MTVTSTKKRRWRLTWTGRRGALYDASASGTEDVTIWSLVYVLCTEYAMLCPVVFDPAASSTMVAALFNDYKENLLYNISHVILSILYLVLMSFSSIKFISLWHSMQRKSPWHRTFYPFLVFGSLIRGVFNLLQPLIMEEIIRFPNQLNFAINIFPSFLFSSSYLVVLFRWVEIYHLAKEHRQQTSHNSNPTPSASYANASASGHNIAYSVHSTYTRDHIVTSSVPEADASYNAPLLPVQVNLQRLFFVLVTVIYIAFFTLIGIDLSGEMDYSRFSLSIQPIEKAIMVYDGSVFVLASVGFAVYAFKILRRMSGSRGRDTIKRIKSIAFITVLAFTVRALFSILSPFLIPAISEYWFTDVCFYGILELLPLTLMLRIIRLDTTSRVATLKDPPNMTTPLINNS
eukprot:TRINITY_DN7617_c0_g1_i4.p1 TRINITY_DN7617_c0_g1~~TRINITY_DN7617_c0_g1_i4.p1  ORF type:complete len:403 (-),score=78.06 TRINITY_DN7617_c0_g1_i4:22-1230(-)